MQGDFFGDLSPFQVIVSVVAFLTGGYSLCTVLAKPKLKIFLSHSIGMIIHPRRVTEKFQVSCNVINVRQKVGALHRLEAKVRDPLRHEWSFEWNLFVEPQQAGAGRSRNISRPFPIAVAPRSSVLKTIEFRLMDGQQMETWPEGCYDFIIYGWANQSSRQCRPNINTTFHIIVDDMVAMALLGTDQTDDVVLNVPVAEWSLSTTR
jgi:hypothetical protein